MQDLVQIHRYDLSYYAGCEKDRRRYRASIGLRDEKGRLVGAAYFHPDSAVVSLPAMRTETGTIILNYPLSLYPHVVDILRNEKPVFVRFKDGEPPSGSIDTSVEPVGEGIG